MKNINKFSSQPMKSDKNWLIIFIIVSIIIILSSITFNIATTKVVPNQANTLKSATPGYNFSQGSQDSFGLLLEVKEVEMGKEYNFKSEFPTHNTTVIVSEENIVLFISERLSFNPEHTLDSYISELGKPQLVLNYYKFSDAVKANVFLDKGLVVFAHVKDGTVQALWYFEPTTETKFMETWGRDLTTEEHGPEAF